MHLVSLEKNGGPFDPELAVPLPTERSIDALRNVGDRVTIGRSADCGLVVSGPAASLLSRLHCTVVRQEGGYLVLDGDGTTLSRNGIYAPSGDRVKQWEINAPGDYVDLLSTGGAILMIRLLGKDGQLTQPPLPADRETSTGGADGCNIEVIEMLRALRSWQEKQEARTEAILQKVDSLADRQDAHEAEIIGGELPGAVKNLQATVEKLAESIGSESARNDIQSRQLKRGTQLLCGIGALVIIFYCGSNLDPQRRQAWEEIALNLALLAIGSTATVGVVANTHRRADEPDSSH